MTIIRRVCTLETTKNGRQTFFSVFCILQTRTNSNTHTDTQRNEEQLKYWGNLFAHINFYLARQRICTVTVVGYPKSGHMGTA